MVPTSLPVTQSPAATTGPNSQPTKPGTPTPTTGLVPTTSPDSTTFAPIVPGTPTGAPTEPFIRIRVTDYYIAYVIPLLTEPPTPEEAAELLAVTRDFWFEYFVDFYADSEIQFRDLVLTIDEEKFGMGIPEERYNYFLDFDTVVLYAEDSPEPPGARETFSIMSRADFVSYILDYVRSLPTFISCNEVEFQAIEFLVTVRPTRVPTATPTTSVAAFGDDEDDCGEVTPTANTRSTPKSKSDRTEDEVSLLNATVHQVVPPFAAVNLSNIFDSSQPKPPTVEQDNYPE